MHRIFQDIRKLCRVTLAFLVALGLPASDVYGGGTLPGGNVRISDAGAGGTTLANVRITERDGTYYAVWEDDRDGGAGFGPSGVYFAKSTDGGKSWSANRRVSSFPAEDWINEPDIAVQPDGTIWIVWHWLEDQNFADPNDVRIAKSTDGGASFQVSTLVDGEDGQKERWTNRIVVDESSGLPYVMVHRYNTDDDTAGFDFYLLRYDETTEQWSDPVPVNDAPHPGRVNPDYGFDYGVWFSLAARGGLICAAWEDRGRDLNERQPIYGACSSDGGVSFGTDFKISDGDNIRPEIAIGPEGELYVIYAHDDEAEKNIRLRRWSPAQQVATLDEAGSEIRDWELAVDANGQLLISFVYDHGAFAPSDLYLATSVDR